MSSDGLLDFKKTFPPIGNLEATEGKGETSFTCSVHKADFTYLQVSEIRYLAQWYYACPKCLGELPPDTKGEAVVQCASDGCSIPAAVDCFDCGKLMCTTHITTAKQLAPDLKGYWPELENYEEDESGLCDECLEEGSEFYEHGYSIQCG